MEYVSEGKFGEVIRCLEDRGWEEAKEPGSAALSWRNLSKTEFESIPATTVVNHLRGAQVLSHKASLARLVFDDEAWTTWYPRCYDLRDRRHAGSLVRAMAAFSAMSRVVEAACGRADAAAAACVRVVERFVAEPRAALSEAEVADAATALRAEVGPIKLCGRGKRDAGLAERARRALKALPQHTVHSRSVNVWILKPAGGSCGEGVEVVSSLEEIAAKAAAAGGRLVVQKYVERPLLVRRKKFDIRQWILVTETEPLAVYGFSSCYARFAGVEWSLSDASRAAHLCNYSVQKEVQASPDATDAFPPFEESMWRCEDLAKFLDSVVPDAWRNVVQPQIKRIAVAVARLGRRAGMTKVAHGFEWLGLDLILADDLCVWLLEVNVSPDVSLSTPVTAALVPPATEDALRLLLDEGRAKPRPRLRYPIEASRTSTSDHRWELWYDEIAYAPPPPPFPPRDDRSPPPVERPFVYRPETSETMAAWWADIMRRLASRAPPETRSADASSSLVDDDAALTARGGSDDEL